MREYERGRATDPGGRRERRYGRLLSIAGCIALLGAIAMSAAGCGGDDATGGTQAASGPKPALTVGLDADFASLNAAKDGAGNVPAFRALFMAPLIHIKPDGSTTADNTSLATSYRYVGDGNKTFELKLRSGARFSDGTPVDAAAVKKWLTYFPTEKGPFAALLPIKSIDTPDATTVILHLREPNPIVPYTLSEAGLNWGSVSAPDALADPKGLARQPAGAGPYVLVPSQSAPGDHYTLVPNKYYWDKSGVKWSKITAKVISNPNTMLQALKTGQVDISVGDLTTADAAKAAGFDVEAEAKGWAALAIEDRGGKLVKALADVRVRQAMNYAIDRDAIAKGLGGGYAFPSDQMGTTDGVDPALDRYYTYDPAKAKSLLAAAGYPNGFALTIMTLGSDPGLVAQTQAVAKYLGDIGVKVKINSVSDPAQYVQKLGTGEFPVVLDTGGRIPMVLAYNYVFRPDALINPNHVQDPVLDKLAARGVVSSDPGPIWKAMSKRIVEQAMYVVYMQPPRIWYASDKVGGVHWEPAANLPVGTGWFPR